MSSKTKYFEDYEIPDEDQTMDPDKDPNAVEDERELWKTRGLTMSPEELEAKGIGGDLT